MNTSPFRTAIAGLVAGGVLVGLLLGWRMVESRRRAAEEQAEAFVECRRLVQQIRSLKDQPHVAGSREQPLKELAATVEQCAEAASLPSEALSRIEPGAPRRLGKTAYLEQEISVELRSTTLPQLSQFLHSASTRSGVRVKRLQLLEPRRGGEGESWGVEVVFAYLIYAPQSAAAKSSR